MEGRDLRPRVAFEGLPVSNGLELACELGNTVPNALDTPSMSLWNVLSASTLNLPLHIGGGASNSMTRPLSPYVA